MNNEVEQEQFPAENQPEILDRSRPAQPFTLPIVSIERKWYTNKALIALLVLAFVVAGAGGSYAYYVMNLKTEQPVADEVAPAVQTTPKPLVPYALAYSINKTGTKTLSTIHQKTLDGGDTTVNEGKEGLLTTNYATYKNLVAYTTEPSYGSTEGLGIWLSTDSGESYEKIYSGEPAAKGTMGEQVTSIVFANDGKSVVFGSLPPDAKKNTVKEIDVTSKKASDLFTLDTSGVFIQAYNRAKHQVYYFSGCYNCDGVNFSTLHAYDVDKKSDSVLFDDQKYTSMHAVVNSDATKLLRSKADSSNTILEEVDLATKKARTITSQKIAENGEIEVIGYSDSDGSPYYVAGKDLLIVNGEDIATPLLKASVPIMNIYYLGKDQVIYSKGSGSESHSVLSYDIASQKSTTLLDYTYNDTIFGISWK